MSSAHTIASNDDIVMEILLRLPAKQLIKCRLVSKRWLYLISDPNFMVRHRGHYAKSVSGFILASVRHFKLPPTYMHLSLDETENSTHSRAFKLCFDPDAPGSTMILQSCNGLLLCYSRRYRSHTPCKRYVFNPTTYSFSILPEPEPVSGHRSIDDFSLAYEPTVSSVYLVVCVQFYSQSSCRIQIYSSETGNWRNIGNQVVDLFSSRFQYGVFWNGGIHWINVGDANSCRFDIQNETIQAMPRPSLPEEWNCNNFRHFLESQGHLFFISFHSPEYIIYEMEKDCSKWFVKHRLDVNLIVSAFPDMITRNQENSSNPLLELEKLISLVSMIELENEGPTMVMYIPGTILKCLCFSVLESDFPYQKPMSSVDIVASNEDIIMEILLRLPAKSLVKLRLVSRRWFHLISDPNFMVRHLRYHAKSVSGFILGSVLHFKLPPSYMYLSLDETENSTQIRAFKLCFDPDALGSTMILQSCNGLFLCYSRRYRPPTPSRYSIFNPTTHSFSILPEPEPVSGHRCIHRFSLAYEPTVSSVYLVVCFQLYSQSSCRVQIYSSETGNWRNARNQVFDLLFSKSFQCGVFWNGGIHWINVGDANSCRFDIENETLQTMPRTSLPEEWNCYNFRHFLESQGHLFFISFHSPEYIIYEMEKDCSKWFVKHRLDVNLIVSAFPDMITANQENSSIPLLELEKLISLVSLIELENEGPTLVMYIPGRFICYSFKVDSFKTVHEDKFYGSNCKFYWYHTYKYMETLSHV